MEQTRIERMPLVLQTSVQHLVHHCSFCTERRIRTFNKQLLKLPRLPFRHFCFCGNNRIRTYLAFRQRFYRPHQLSNFDVFPILSGKQDSNLQPLASKASKQPIVIFPEVTQSILQLHRETV